MRTLVAILALSPALLHAQAKLPAQPVSTPTLVAALTPPAAPSAAETVKPFTGKVSTGVIPAHLVHTVDLAESSTTPRIFSQTRRTVTVNMMVDETGKPADLHLVQTADPFTNREVLEAVSQFRYQPATVSGMAVASPVSLQVIVRKN